MECYGSLKHPWEEQDTYHPILGDVAAMTKQEEAIQPVQFIATFGFEYHTMKDQLMILEEIHTRTYIRMSVLT